MSRRLEFVLAAHEGRARTALLALPVGDSAAPAADFAGARWALSLVTREKSPGALACRFTATVVSGRATDVAAGLRWTDDAWSPANHVLIPGAVYAGNRFDAERRPYQPIPRDIGQRGDRLHLDIGDLPRLSAAPGRSHLDQSSLDAAIPALGVWFPARRAAFLLLTPQATRVGPYGFEVIENADRTRAELLLLAPGFNHPLPDETATVPPAIANLASIHLHPENPRPADLAAGESIVLDFEWHEFASSDLQPLFDRVFTHRQTMFPEAAAPAPDVIPFSAVWDILHTKHNTQNWHEGRCLYQVGLPWLPNQATQFWQNAWLGGGIPTLAMIQDGDARSLARARRNLAFLLTDAIAPSGFFKAIMSEEGEWFGDKRLGGREPWVLMRRQGECLYFVVRQLQLLRERGHTVPESWLDAARRVATSLCDLWDREGEFGFMLNYDTVRFEIRGSTSGALIPAALVLASAFLAEPRFLAGATASAEHYRTHDLAWGVTTGGPGDALQAPDSESVFGLVESFILLHETTAEPRWLDAARHACAQAASWAISYPYKFPARSTLARLGIDARGAMIANAQNKCGVPGICTLSGQGLLRVFRATGDIRLLDLLRDIAHALPQFLSRADRPIPAGIGWGHPGFHLAPGWMCERVNITPSWNEPLGEQANYSCWCEVAMMLTWTDLPGVYAQPDTGLIRCIDHVRAEWTDATRTALRLVNPTPFPARVRLLVETSAEARSHVLPPNFGATLPVVAIPAGGENICVIKA